MFEKFNKLCIKNPIYKIIFVLEMIVKAFSVHVAALADLRHIDLFEGLILHQSFQRNCQCPLGNIGICHTQPPFITPANAPLKSKLP